MAKGRNYRQEYDRYQGTPKQIKRRSERNKARAIMEKANGSATIPRNVDVDHAKPIAKGGGNQKSNLRLRSQRANRSFPRTSKAKMK